MLLGPAAVSRRRDGGILPPVVCNEDVIRADVPQREKVSIHLRN